RAARPTARKTAPRRKAARGPAALKSPGVVVSTEWLAANLANPRVRVVDGSWHMPPLQREGGGQFQEAQFPGARCFAVRETAQPARVRGSEQLRRTIRARRQQGLDARSRGRVYGTEPEPRQGLRPGHIPGSFNLPYDILYRPDGTLLPPEGLKEVFREAGLDSRKPVATTCGSGVTASILALGLPLIGHKKVAVYDGSWTAWGGRPGTPVEL